MIGVKNMEMPKSCMDCPFRHCYGYKWSECLASVKTITFPHSEIFHSVRCSDCPLIELEENK